MAGGIFQSTPIPLLEQVINFSQERHGVLAGNIANIDTPDYKTRDLSPELFQESLKQAIQANRVPASPGRETTSSFATVGARVDAFAQVGESIQGMLRHDGGDVSLERQITEMAKNHSQHNLAINIMAAQFRLMRAAISERVA